MKQERSERTISAAYWSTTGESPEYGNGFNSSDDNCIRVDGETVHWEQAMNAMNAALEQEGIEWRYALNTGDDANIRPLILVKQDA